MASSSTTSRRRRSARNGDNGQTGDLADSMMHTNGTATKASAHSSASTSAALQLRSLIIQHDLASHYYPANNDYRSHFAQLHSNALTTHIYTPYNLSKQRGERFFLLYSLCYWIPLMAYIVLTGAYHHFNALSYMKVGVSIALPAVVVPLLFPSYCDDPMLAIHQRYTTKANVYIWVISYIGNYLWTHYFYTVLHCSYTLPAEPYVLNSVPFALYLITHGYFHFYHTISNMLLRVYWRTVGEGQTLYYHSGGDSQHRRKPTLLTPVLALVGVSLLVFTFSYVTAFMEAWTIARFEHYVIPDRHSMYLYGSVFYAIYFWCSFPVFYRMDEGLGECWSVQRTFIEVCGACMMVTMILDAWRLLIGDLNSITSPTAKVTSLLQKAAPSNKYIPWL